MSRYIDADAFLKEYCEPYPHVFMAMSKAMAEAPSIDIVRCKECKWYGNEQKKIYECCTYWAQDGGVLVPTKADDFCSYGERQD